MKAKQLLAEVCECPDDDGPRLVYADWLEEHGDEAERERAEFIRVQVRLAQIDDCDPEYPGLVRRQAKLSRHHNAWCGALPAWARKSNPKAVFRRGFIEKFWAATGQFVKSAEKLFTVVPLREMELSSVLRSLPEFVASP